MGGVPRQGRGPLRLRVGGGPGGVRQDQQGQRPDRPSRVAEDHRGQRAPAGPRRGAPVRRRRRPGAGRREAQRGDGEATAPVAGHRVVHRIGVRAARDQQVLQRKPGPRHAGWRRRRVRRPHRAQAVGRDRVGYRPQLGQRRRRHRRGHHHPRRRRDRLQEGSRRAGRTGAGTRGRGGGPPTRSTRSTTSTSKKRTNSRTTPTVRCWAATTTSGSRSASTRCGS